MGAGVRVGVGVNVGIGVKVGIGVGEYVGFGIAVTVGVSVGTVASARVIGGMGMTVGVRVVRRVWQLAERLRKYRYCGRRRLREYRKRLRWNIGWRRSRSRVGSTAESRPSRCSLRMQPRPTISAEDQESGGGCPSIF